jgi:hypothetical protein
MDSKYLQKISNTTRIPDILHDFGRDILRDQPEDILHYGVSFFTALEKVNFKTRIF